MYNSKIMIEISANLNREISEFSAAIREILECCGCGIVDNETALAMRDHIDSKIEHLNDICSAVTKANRTYNAVPVTGPMSRKTPSVVQLTESEKALISEAYERYFPDFG